MNDEKPDLIILAAGHSIGADGVIKCLLKHPITRKNIIETAREIFPDFLIRVVVGYRALEIISEFPEFEYIINNEWSFTGNAYSLSLALQRKKTLVLSGDLFLTSDIRGIIYENIEKSFVFSKKTEQRRVSAINLKVSKEGTVNSIYTGKMESIKDPESLGAFWVANEELIEAWKNSCLMNPQKFAGECLPVPDQNLYSLELKSEILQEITDANDFLKFKNQGMS